MTGSFTVFGITAVSPAPGTPPDQLVPSVQEVLVEPSHVVVAANPSAGRRRAAIARVARASRRERGVRGLESIVEAKRVLPRMTCPILPTFSSFKTKRTNTSARERETRKGFDRGETGDLGRLPEKTKLRHAPVRVPTNTEATPGLAFEIARPWR
jgi:hypothetical protein